MAVQNILPSTQLTGVDIRDTINNFGGSANDNWLTYYQADDANKWSKFKSVKYNAIHTTGNENPPWWKAADGCCGFKKSSIVFSSLSDLVTAYKNQATYVYDPPTGGTSTPMRGGDWRNYNKNAVSPIWSHEVTGQLYASNGSSSITSTCLGNGDVNTAYNLVIGDLLPSGSVQLSNYYYGVIVVNSSGTIRVKTNANMIGSAAIFANNTVTLTYNEIGSLGKVTIYPAFFSMKQTTTSASMAAGTTLVACPAMANGASVGRPITPSASPLEGQIGWMSGSAYYTIVGAKTTFGGQIAYKISDGSNVTITVRRTLNGTTTVLRTETVALKSNSTSDGIKYMNYSTILNMSHESGATYSLQLSISGTTSTINCEQVL